MLAVSGVQRDGGVFIVVLRCGGAKAGLALVMGRSSVSAADVVTAVKVSAVLAWSACSQSSPVLCKVDLVVLCGVAQQSH
jgi:hypothetical protein